jgi:hypothetical protein
MHFKFSRDVYKKVETAVKEKQHGAVTAEYDALRELLGRMIERRGSFLYRLSRSASNFGAFVDTGNARFE